MAMELSPSLADNRDMTDSPLLVFDDGAGSFGPLTDLRPVFEIRTAALTNRQRIEIHLSKPTSALFVSPALVELTACENPALLVNPTAAALTTHHGGLWLVVNGRLIGQQTQAILTKHVRSNGPWAVIDENGQWLAGVLSPAGIEQLQVNRWQNISNIKELASPVPPPLSNPPSLQAVVEPTSSPVRLSGNHLYSRPWDILDHLEPSLLDDLAHLSCDPILDCAFPSYVHVIPGHRVVVQNARLQPGVVLNAEAGPIYLSPDAVIGANTVIEGPCFVGEHVQVAARSYLRSQTVIGPYCKVAGEIACSIFQSHSNKAHDGYVGHSLVGKWVNLGAGTTVSNLKNTYGSVRVQLDPALPAENSGRTFQGPVIGDFVRTAIGSRLMTGSCLNTGSMIALSSFAPKSTQRMGFYTDAQPKSVPTDMEKFLVTAKAMMSRRHVTMSPAMESRLRALHG